MCHMEHSEFRALVIDDDVDLRAALTEYISQMKISVRTAGSVAEAQRLIQTESSPFDLVLVDLKIPGGTGMDVLRTARTRSPNTLVTIITGYASMETAIDAIRLGAYNYITKPFSLNEIGVQVRNMVERVTLSKENARLSLRLQELYQQINRVQNERVDVIRLHEDLSRQMQENARKLDQILAISASKATNPPILMARPENSPA
jgi:DNA-binding NtrC family response regulator